MKLGIVGHEAAKFTPQTEALARRAISSAIATFGPEALVSGRSPLGGVDLWAEAAAAEWGLDMIVHAPEVHAWDGVHRIGFKQRNLAIARDSDHVLVIVVRELPESYRGMHFNHCYHCKDRVPPHVKSGGCWTAWKCSSRSWHIIDTPMEKK